MTSDDANQENMLNGGVHPTLRRLADVLGCTVEDFYNKPPVDVERLSTLVSLWSNIKSDKDCAKVLDLLRNYLRNPEI